MADIVYHNSPVAAYTQLIDLPNDTVKCALLLAAHTPERDDAGWADLSADEISGGNGYTTGGVTVACSIADDDSNDRAAIDLVDPTWTASGGAIGPASYAVVYDDTATGKPLLYLVEFASPQTANDGAQFKITIDTNGLFYID